MNTLSKALQHITALVLVIDQAAPTLTDEQGAALAKAWLFKNHEQTRQPPWDQTAFLLNRLYNAAARYYTYCVAGETKTSVHRSEIESEFFAALLDVKTTLGI